MKHLLYFYLMLASLLADVAYRFRKYQPETPEDCRRIVQEAVWQAKQKNPQ